MKTLYHQGVISSKAGYEVPVNTGDGKYSSYLEILNRIDEQLAAMLSYHNKLIVVRIDLHLHEYEPHNKTMSEFVRVFMKRLKRIYKLKRVGFIWVRERERAKKQHYHFAVILDGNKCKHSKRIIELAREIWQGRDFGSVPHIPKPYHLIVRGNAQSYQTTFYRLSYLAKERGKGIGKNGKARASTANDYSTSRIKPKP